jgi:hypothetical protein
MQKRIAARTGLLKLSFCATKVGTPARRLNYWVNACFPFP